MKKKVYITCPNGTGWIHKRVAFSMIQLLRDPRYEIRMDLPTHSPFVDNLHACMNDFMDNGDDYWLSMDDDNPPQRNPLDLVSLDLDIIGFPTPVWHSAVPGDRPWYFNALRAVEGGWVPADVETTTHPQEVDAIGTGCFLIARRVFEELRYEQPFMRTWDEKTGRVEIGNDYSFCRKAKAKGFRIWTHFGYPCDHFNELPLMEVIERFSQMKRS